MKIKRLYRKRQSLLSYIPFIHLFFCFVSNYISFDYILLGYGVGTSLLTNLFYLIALSTKRYCIYVKIAVLSLITLSLFGILHQLNVIDYINYCKYYDNSLLFLTVFLMAIIYLKNASTKNDNDNADKGV